MFPGKLFWNEKWNCWNAFHLLFNGMSVTFFLLKWSIMFVMAVFHAYGAIMEQLNIPNMMEYFRMFQIYRTFGMFHLSHLFHLWTKYWNGKMTTLQLFHFFDLH